MCLFSEVAKLYKHSMVGLKKPLVPATVVHHIIIIMSGSTVKIGKKSSNFDDLN